MSVSTNTAPAASFPTTERWEGMFKGISAWPRIDDLVSEEAMHRLEKGGLDGFIAAGCRRLSTRPWFDESSAVATGLVQHLVRSHRGVRFRDDSGRHWAATSCDLNDRLTDLVAISFRPLNALDLLFRHKLRRSAERLARSFLAEELTATTDERDLSRLVLRAAFAQDVARAIQLVGFLVARAERERRCGLLVPVGELVEKLWPRSDCPNAEDELPPLFSHGQANVSAKDAVTKAMLAVRCCSGREVSVGGKNAGQRIHVFQNQPTSAPGLRHVSDRMKTIRSRLINRRLS